MMIAISGLTDCLSNLERIRTSPIPFAYTIHLKQTLFLYLASLPFQLLSSMGWATIPILFIASFTLLGIESIGGEIENPFGYDENDLRQDDFIDTVRKELHQIMERPSRIDLDAWATPCSLRDFNQLVAVEKKNI